MWLNDPTRNIFNASLEMVFLGVSLVGLVIRALTVGRTPRGTSGRNIKGQVAEELNTTGIYSTVRHPLYLGNFFMFLGPVLFIRSTWFTLVFSLAYWLYYERIMFAEEQFLRKKFGEIYDSWSSKVPAFIPSFRNYIPSRLPFSFRNVLKREYHGFVNVFFTFALLDFARNSIIYGRYTLTPLWMWLLVGGLATWFIIRMLRKKTRWLNVKGR
jgi:protein-S-isoprenylcysteine O-methyltransferase Ste14